MPARGMGVDIGGAGVGERKKGGFMSRSSGINNLTLDLDSPSTQSGGETPRGRRKSKDESRSNRSRSRDGSRGKSRNKGMLNRSSTESGSSQV